MSRTLCLLVWSCALAGMVLAQDETQSIAGIRRLSPSLLASNPPVTAEGIVTFVNPHGDFVFQNGDSGMFVRYPARPAAQPLRPGDRVRIHGRASRGYYSPVIEAESSERLEIAQLPVAPAATASGMLSGQWDCRMVQVRGIIQAVQSKPTPDSLLEYSLDLVCENWHVPILITSAVPSDTSSWVDAEVRVTGVLTQVLNTRREIIGAKLNANALSAVAIERPPPWSAWEAPLLDSFANSAASPGSHRVRVQGIVSMAVEGDFFYLQWGRNGLRVQSRQPGVLVPGDRVEASGFAELGIQFRELRQAEFRKLSAGLPSPPVDVSTGAILSLSMGPRDTVAEDFEGRVVRIQGTLLDIEAAGDGTLRAYVESDGYPVQNVLPGGISKSALRRFVPGSLVRMSGVCLLEFKASPLAVSQHAPVSGFRLLLRGVDDMELIRAPSWWTPARLQTALVLLLAIAVLAVLWVLGLRRIIARQTVVIAESTAQSVLHEERARLARELHDTLEQHLTGVRMQIETAKSDLAEAPEAVATSLESALGMLVFSQEEARRSVWNLRNAQLIHQGLAVALGNLLPLDPQGPKLRIEVTGSIRRLSAPLEFHLLRIAQEAVTNALKHSGASEIFVNLHFTNSTVTLAVTDDGQGFEPAFAKGGEEGHFGLLGIHERANKIHAQVLIESRPGGGVRIEVSAPTAPPTAGSSP